MSVDSTNNYESQNPVNPDRIKISFSPEQQVKIDELIKAAMGRTGREVRVQLADAQKRITELEQQLVAKPTKTDDDDRESGARALAAPPEPVQPRPGAASAALGPDTNEVDELRTQLLNEKRRADRTAELEEELGKTRQEHANTKLRRVVEEAGAVNADLVLQLLSRQLHVDGDGVLQVVNDNGDPLLNERLEPMTPNELVQQFLASHPYLQKADTHTGAGSSESQRNGFPREDPGKYFGRGSDGAAANALARRDKEKYRRLKQEARNMGLID